MATTTNFSWETPDDTDLVKDGAAAIRTLGNSIDTSFVDLKGGTTGQILSKASGTDLDFTWVAQDDSNAIQNAIVDAKGDLIAATAADTPARLAVGTNGQVLTADSTAATGLAWATAASGGMTLLNTGGTTLSGASTTVSFTATGYTSLYIYFNNAYASVSAERSYLRLNSDSTSGNYAWTGYRIAGTNALTSLTGVSSTAFDYVTNSVPSSSNFNRNGRGVIIINRPNDTGGVYVEGSTIGGVTSSDNYITTFVGAYNNSSAISSLTLSMASGTWSGGTIYVYGVK